MQLSFPLVHRPAFGRNDFLLAATNRQAVELVDAWADWQDKVQLILGPPGCGKTHLGAVLAYQCQIYQYQAHMVRPPRLAKEDQRENERENSLADILAGDRRFDMLIIDGLEQLGHDNEEPLFHLLNHARQSGQKILLLSRLSGGQMNITLPDLASRLKALPAVMMGAPDDTLIGGLLDKLFDDRQLRVDARVVNYLVPRVERDYAAMGRLVQFIDQRALEMKRAITVPFIAEILAETLAN